MTNEVMCHCRNCRQQLEPRHTGKCPNCGQTGKDCVAIVRATVGLKVSVSAERTRTYFEWHNREISAVLVATAADTVIAIVGSMIGWAVSGLWGALIGLAVSVALIFATNIFCRRKVKALIREITKYQ